MIVIAVGLFVTFFHCSPCFGRLNGCLSLDSLFIFGFGFGIFLTFLFGDLTRISFALMGVAPSFTTETCRNSQKEYKDDDFRTFHRFNN